MSPARRPSPRAVLRARSLLRDLAITEPAAIDLEAIAGHLGVLPMPGPLRSGEARLVRVGDVAIARIQPKAYGTPWGRFVLAHELGHFVLHEAHDALAACVTPEQPGAWWADAEARERETEASDFAAELCMPEAMFAPRCDVAPQLASLRELASAFGTSLTATALRFLRYTTEPCAAVRVLRGRVDWVATSGDLALDLAEGDPIAEGTLAIDVVRGPRPEARGDVDAETWGARAGRISEYAVRLDEGGAVLAWLWWHPR